MSIQIYNPTTPGRRQTSVNKSEEITRREPEKKLVMIKKRTGGRNNQGKITVFHRGGGERRYIRILDSKRERYDLPAVVVAIEYDPNRSANIALVEYGDKERRYIISPVGLKVGDTVITAEKAELRDFSGSGFGGGRSSYSSSEFGGEK